MVGLDGLGVVCATLIVVNSSEVLLSAAVISPSILLPFFGASAISAVVSSPTASVGKPIVI